MAKQVRWRIPFVSLNGTQYEIEIYDEGYTGAAVELRAGETPFTTDEDNTDDFFAPIRTQTGTIQVCTAIPGGGTLRLEDILPDNNIARPVQLRRMDDDVVEWQGFLSCEAYSQDYTSIPQVLDLSVISVLEAMGSVECDIAEFHGVQTVHNIVAYALQKMESEAAMGHLFSEVAVSNMTINFMYKYINTTLFFDRKERADEGYTEHFIVGISLQDLLSQLATYVGWCVREQGDVIYFQHIGADANVEMTRVVDIADAQWEEHYARQISQEEMGDLVWRGNTHKQSTKQGARSVEISNALEQSEIELALPDGFPVGDYLTGTIDYISEGTGEDENGEAIDEEVQLVLYASEEQRFDNRYELKTWYQEEISEAKPLVYTEQGGTKEVFADTIPGGESSLNPIGDQHLGTFVARIKNDDIEFDEIGIFVNAYWADVDENIYILKMRSIDHLVAYSGKFVIKYDGFVLHDTLQKFSHIVRDIQVAIKWGDAYLQSDLKTWGSNIAQINLEWTEENGGEIEIPINEFHCGEVELFLFPKSLKWWQTDMAGYTIDEYLLTELSVEYIKPEDIFVERSSNNYYEPLGTAFRDEIVVSSNIASSHKNLPCPSIILNVDPSRYYDPLEKMTFHDTVERSIRPEHHLLERMADYYRKARTVLELQVSQPRTPLPLLTLRGINDGKLYLPMAASRDWKHETSTLTCLETNHWCQIRRWDGKAWDGENDYVLVHGVGSASAVTIYITSSCELTWWDEDFQLQDMTINGTNGTGTIPAGTDVAVTFRLEEEYNNRGRVIFYQQGRRVAAIDVVGEY